GGIEQGFPEKILELHLSHTEAATVGEGSNGIAAHGFHAHAEPKVNLAQRDGVGRLGDGFKTGAANALNQECRAIHGNTGVEANVAGQQVSIEAGWSHAAGDDGADVFSRNAAATQD